MPDAALTLRISTLNAGALKRVWETAEAAAGLCQGVLTQVGALATSLDALNAVRVDAGIAQGRAGFTASSTV